MKANYQNTKFMRSSHNVLPTSMDCKALFTDEMDITSFKVNSIFNLDHPLYTMQYKHGKSKIMRSKKANKEK